MQRFSNVMRAGAIALAGVLLAGCMQDYLVRRETVSQNGGDAIAANRATQMVDPWSRASADKNIAFNGEKMQSAVERYRTNKVIPPKGTATTSNFASESSDPAAAPAAATPAAAAAPVK